MEREDVARIIEDDHTHATTPGAAAAGAVVAGAIGLAGGPLSAAIGAVGGAIVGAAAERMMHSDDEADAAQELRLASDAEARTASVDTSDASPSAAALDHTSGKLHEGSELQERRTEH